MTAILRASMSMGGPGGSAVVAGGRGFGTPPPLRYPRPSMNILSIQSHVAYGHVGNAAAVFPLQRLGVEVWPVHTVQYSNHTGYGHWRGRALSAEAIRRVVDGIEECGVLGECDGVLSGYIGSADV